MLRSVFAATGLICAGLVFGTDEKMPSFSYEVARAHAIKPHRRNIPQESIEGGFNNTLSLSLMVSAKGDVTDVQASGAPEVMRFWPELEGEVRRWKFVPFERDGKPVAAKVQEYLELDTPERLPKVHVPAPVLRADSTVIIVLERTRCYGSCPAYVVAVGTDGLIIFDGGYSVVAEGKHSDHVAVSDVRKLAERFVAADFYSMDRGYAAMVTDLPTVTLSISIDGQTKQVSDYMGQWVGMPAVIHDLEDEVDAFARSERWVRGGDGLVAALKAENFDFKTFEAQTMAKLAAVNGETATVKQFLRAGVPLKAMPSPKPESGHEYLMADEGWLTAASQHADTLRVLMEAGVSRTDQADKDSALGRAVRMGSAKSAQALIAYGANPHSGALLRDAASSGRPNMVREILRYHPQLEVTDSEGKTALFAAVAGLMTGDEVARGECVHLLIQAGANVSARDSEGNTPLHGANEVEVAEELLKAGADVNARNKNGETPIFRTFNDRVVLLYVRHGADLSARNLVGRTVPEAVALKGAAMTEALRKAMAEKKNN